MRSIFIQWVLDGRGWRLWVVSLVAGAAIMGICAALFSVGVWWAVAP